MSTRGSGRFHLPTSTSYWLILTATNFLVEDNLRSFKSNTVDEGLWEWLPAPRRSRHTHPECVQIFTAIRSETFKVERGCTTCTQKHSPSIWRTTDIPFEQLHEPEPYHLWRARTVSLRLLRLGISAPLCVLLGQPNIQAWRRSPSAYWRWKWEENFFDPLASFFSQRRHTRSRWSTFFGAQHHKSFIDLN